MSLHEMHGVAGEDLTICRVVRRDPTAEGSLEFFMADSSAVEPAGVTPEACQDAPGIGSNDVTLAAESGRPLRIAGRGHSVLVRVGAVAVVAGERVKVNAANGVIGPLLGSESAGEWTVGVPWRSALAGELVYVYIDPQQIARPVS
jgi:hypothetical protein